MDPEVYLARELEKLKRAQRAKGSTPQLGTSSIEDGTLLVNEDGVLKGSVGMQPDGTNTTVQYNGPPPPIPSRPSIELMNEAVRISWDGAWLEGAVAPLDLVRVDVHAVTAPDADPLATPSIATINSFGWGDALVPLPPAIYYFALVAWTTSGKFTVGPLTDALEVAPLVIPTDGLPPAESPKVIIRGGINMLIARWDSVANQSEIDYDLHLVINDPDGVEFEPAEGNLVASSRGNVLVFQGVLPDGTPLVQGATYFARIVARDADGSADPGQGGSATIHLVQTADIAPQAITSTEIADFAIPVKKLHSTTHLIY